MILSWPQHAYSLPLSAMGDIDPKVVHTDLVFGVWLGFISGSVHVRLQVSVCSGYDLFHRGKHPDTQTDTHTHRQAGSIMTSLFDKLSKMSWKSCEFNCSYNPANELTNKWMDIGITSLANWTENSTLITPFIYLCFYTHLSTHHVLYID